MHFALSWAATFLTTRFAGVHVWTAGLAVYLVASGGITQLDELMHLRACIGLYHKCMGALTQREVVVAVTTNLRGPSTSVYTSRTGEHKYARNAWNGRSISIRRCNARARG